jgi:dihydroflavonol-4-reductase
MSGEQVLVTGGSGFVGAHCVARLLAGGYRVRTTVRSPARAAAARDLLAAAGVAPGDRLGFATADLTSDTDWPAAVAGCDFVLHVASPVAQDDTADRDGTLRVLRAARDAGVRRVVLTSSFTAVGYGHEPATGPFTEDDWTEPTADLPAHVRATTLAERAAWDFVAAGGGDLELSVVNPVSVFGPVLGPRLPGSVELVAMLLDGALPATPRLTFAVVDVRDVADLEVLAMTSPAARGERFVAATGDTMTLHEIALLLRARLGATAHRVPTRTLPSVAVRVLARIASPLRAIVPDLDRVRRADAGKARQVLGWTTHSTEDTIVATADSLTRLGLLRDSPDPG